MADDTSNTNCCAQYVSTFRELAYFVMAPVPFLLLARIARHVFDRRCHVEKFAQSLPLTVPAVFAYVAGEFVGYLAGRGDTLLKVE